MNCQFHVDFLPALFFFEPVSCLPKQEHNGLGKGGDQAVHRYLSYIKGVPGIDEIECLNIDVKTAQKQKVLVDSLLDAYAEDVGCKSLREVDAMRHAAEAAVEFVRLFAVLEAGRSTLSQSQVEQYCTGVVLHSLQEAEKLCLTDSTRTSNFDRI